MPRKDLSELRSNQILDAFERCIVDFGMEGASLERIAGAAGMKRSILRHYVGNRDDLIRALALRFHQRYEQELEDLRSWLPTRNRVNRLIDVMFSAEGMDEADEVLVFQALTTAIKQYPWLGEIIRGTIDMFINMVAAELEAAYPDKTKQDCWSTAYGVAGIYFNQAAMPPLDLPPRYLRSAKRSAITLIESLSTG